MDAELKSKWIEALRSGKYTQGSGALREGGKHCCLGVACDILNPDLWEDDDEGFGRFMSQSILWPREVQERFGLDYIQASKLWNMNDDGKSFDHIADYIEANL